MGYRDESRATLTCRPCEITEEVVALETGADYGKGSWGSFRSKHFDVTDDGNEFQPSVVSAVCKKCHKPVSVGPEEKLKDAAHHHIDELYKANHAQVESSMEKAEPFKEQLKQEKLEQAERKRRFEGGDIPPQS